jgi:murein L,D-transpeptidase YcbB/YkuD
MNKNIITMKRLKLAALVVLATQAQSSWALTDQLNYADKYYLSKAGVALVQSGLNSLYNIVSPTPISINSDIIVDNRESKTDTIPDFFDLIGDIYPGAKHKNISALQKQLGLPETGTYDKELVKKVQKLQSEKGLNSTGIIDRNTWFAIYDQPLEWKVKTIKTARENWNAILEKHRNHPNPLMIVVNVPSMKLYVYKKKQNGYDLVMQSKVIVGRPNTQTPLNDFELISLKYSPNWTPTKNMLRKNLYKNGQLNLKWLEEHGLALIDEAGNPRDYNELGSITAPRFVQPSGNSNALGNLKFETSSKEDIYMHDTNERNKFGFNTRAYSSGCVRVEDYLNLASVVSEKPQEKVQGNIDKHKMFYERLPKRVPVYFDYSQVHFNGENDMMFFSDVYSKNNKRK